MEPGVAYNPMPKPQDTSPNPAYQPPTRLIMAIMVVFVLILGGAFAVKYVKKPNPSLSTAIPTTPTMGTYFPPATTSTPKITNSNPDWKEYVDPTNIFLVKYPAEYNLNKYSESAFNGIQLEYTKPASSASASAQITLKIIYLQHSAKTAEQFVSDQMALEKNATRDGLTLNLKGEWGRGKIIFMEQDGTVYRLSSIIAAPLNLISGYEDTVNKIFASFTILNPDDRGK